MIVIVCTLLSAAGFYASFGLGDCWPLAFIAAVPILWLAFGNTRAWIVFFAALASFALGATHAILAYGGILPLPVMALIIFGPALLFGAAVTAASRTARRLGPVAGVVAFASFWTALDYLSALGRSGAVMSPAYSLTSAPVFIQSASLFGLGIVVFVLALTSAGIAMSFRTRTIAPVAVATIIFAANALFGLWHIAQAANGPVTRIGLGVDDSLAPASSDATAASAATVVGQYAKAARGLAAQGATLIVFPEKLAHLKPAWRQAALDTLAATAQGTSTTIVIGFDDQGRDRFNEALVFTPQSPPQIYAKRRFVPVLEDGFKTGAGHFVLPDKTGVAICKDMDYPAMLRADQRAGHPTLLAVPAWDFDADGLSHAEPAIMRGVENGFALARASRDGLLTLTDATGRVVAMKRSSSRGMVTVAGNVARGPGDTLYVHIGDVFAWTCLMLSIGFIVLSFAQNKRAAEAALIS